MRNGAMQGERAKPHTAAAVEVVNHGPTGKGALREQVNEENNINETAAVPEVSVVLVSFNTRELTLQALASLYESVGEDGPRLQVILVDNCGSDGTVEAVAARFPEVEIIHAPGNLGFGRGNNLGVERAGAERVLLLNTDTIVKPGAVQALMKTLDSESDVGIAGARLLNPDGSHQPSALVNPTVWSTFCMFFWLDRLFPRSSAFSGAFRTGLDPERPADVQAVHGAALMIRRDLYRGIGGFDPEYFMYYEENDLCRRVGDLGFRIRYEPTARVVHLERGSQTERPWWVYYAMRQSRMIYARKYMSFPARVAMQMIVHTGYTLRILLYGVMGLVRPRFRSLSGRMLRSYLHGASYVATRKKERRTT